MVFPAFLPAVGKQAPKELSRTVRSWRLRRRAAMGSADLARVVSPVARGWVNYYGRFYRSALYPLLDRVNAYLLRWIQKRCRAGMEQALPWLAGGHTLRPRYFAHWAWVAPAGSRTRTTRAV